MMGFFKVIPAKLVLMSRRCGPERRPAVWAGADFAGASGLMNPPASSIKTEVALIEG
jgi:hypothetical protein